LEFCILPDLASCVECSHLSLLIAYISYIGIPRVNVKGWKEKKVKKESNVFNGL